MFLLLTLNIFTPFSFAFIVDFEQANVSQDVRWPLRNSWVGEPLMDYTGFHSAIAP